MLKTLLIVDDEAAIRQTLDRFFRLRHFQVYLAGTGARGLETARQVPLGVALVDLRLPDMDGMEVLRGLKRESPSTGAVILTGHGDIESAVAAMKEGAEHFLTKPVDLEALAAVVELAMQKGQLASDVDYLRRQQSVLQESPGRKPLRFPPDVARAIHLLSGNPQTSAFLSGETGTGKGAVAHAIHESSPRRLGQFVEINCAGLGAALLETELFGYERGAFTDARERKQGLLEVADRGTLFLDEITEMDLAVQAKLLKVLEDRRFRRLGGTTSLEVDVRFLCATNTDVDAVMAEGRFRRDLYFRLNVIPVHLPPLRERPDDILPLAEDFLREFSARMARPIRALPVPVRDLLIRYPWPGNIRELRNLMERAVLLCSGTTLGEEHFPALRAPASGGAQGFPTLEDIEREHILKALDLSDGNKSQAARLLGIHRFTLMNKLKKY